MLGEKVDGKSLFAPSIVISLGTKIISKNKSLKIKQKSDAEDRYKSRRICRHVYQNKGETSSSKMETSAMEAQAGG